MDEIVSRGAPRPHDWRAGVRRSSLRMGAGASLRGPRGPGAIRPARFSPGSLRAEGCRARVAAHRGCRGLPFRHFACRGPGGGASGGARWRAGGPGGGAGRSAGRNAGSPGGSAGIPPWRHGERAFGTRAIQPPPSFRRGPWSRALSRRLRMGALGTWARLWTRELGTRGPRSSGAAKCAHPSTRRSAKRAGYRYAPSPRNPHASCPPRAAWRRSSSGRPSQTRWAWRRVCARVRSGRGRRHSRHANCREAARSFIRCLPALAGCGKANAANGSAGRVARTWGSEPPGSPSAAIFAIGCHIRHARHSWRVFARPPIPSTNSPFVDEGSSAP
jgi:hypothetical protein